jgi:hypothetical protein
VKQKNAGETKDEMGRPNEICKRKEREINTDTRTALGRGQKGGETFAPV